MYGPYGVNGNDGDRGESWIARPRRNAGDCRIAGSGRIAGARRIAWCDGPGRPDGTHPSTHGGANVWAHRLNWGLRHVFSHGAGLAI